MQDETNISETELHMLDEEVIKLHSIARTLEQAFGQRGQLSDDIRNCADRLSELLKRY
jgi:hypothetical protein